MLAKDTLVRLKSTSMQYSFITDAVGAWKSQLCTIQTFLYIRYLMHAHYWLDNTFWMWDCFHVKGPSAYIIKIPVHAVEMLRLRWNVWVNKKPYNSMIDTSILDLSRGYWQVPMSAQSRAKTAFVTSYGLFEFNVMPFGLQGAPSTFQRMMDQLLRGLEDCAAAYLDDLLIHNATWPEHLASLRKVLERLRTAGLTAKPSKCHFAMKECTYLGHIVGNGQVRPEIGKLTAVEDFPVPKTKKEVRTFLGLTGYYRKFVPCYASLAAPLTELTRSNAPTIVKWTTSCNTAFMDLKRLLCSSPVLQCRPFNTYKWSWGGVGRRDTLWQWNCSTRNHFSCDSPASGYDDICIAEWLESIECSKLERTFWCSEDTIGDWIS